jgi:hypothetical protein
LILTASLAGPFQKLFDLLVELRGLTARFGWRRASAGLRWAHRALGLGTLRCATTLSLLGIALAG